MINHTCVNICLIFIRSELKCKTNENTACVFFTCTRLKIEIKGKGTMHCSPIGILLPGTELLDSPVRMEFSPGSFHAVFIWLTMKFSSDWSSTRVMSLTLQQSQGHPPMASIYFTVKFELPTL